MREACRHELDAWAEHEHSLRVWVSPKVHAISVARLCNTNNQTLAAARLFTNHKSSHKAHYEINQSFTFKTLQCRLKLFNCVTLSWNMHFGEWVFWSGDFEALITKSKWTDFMCLDSLWWYRCRSLVSKINKFATFMYTYDTERIKWAMHRCTLRFLAAQFNNARLCHT